ncbi:Aldo/keto reductase [Atractiella rhizophila]|nr:Aldo/keto reductase [Atractiella rhizophila]
MAGTNPLRKLGKNGPRIPALGFGAMGLSVAYGAVPADEERVALLKKVLDSGTRHIDTAAVYGDSESLLGKVFNEAGWREKAFIATKFGLTYDPTTWTAKVKGRKEDVKASLENSLKLLAVDSVDLFYQHRVDRSVTIEETWLALAELQKEGKVKYLGISEASAEEIRKAHKVAPISALQIEFSPWSTEIRENGILETCRELGIAIVAYSPLGRGFLTGAFKTPDDLDADDWRRTNPRFQGEAFYQNLKLVEEIKAIAEKKGCKPSQLCLAWVLAQGDDFFAIPGTKKQKYFEENLGALNVILSEDEIKEIESAISRCQVIGERYPESQQALLAS